MPRLIEHHKQPVIIALAAVSINAEDADTSVWLDPTAQAATLCRRAADELETRIKEYLPPE